MLNGTALPSFKPERGLRQGDPLSPYLFVIITEAFSHVIHETQAGGKMSGVSITKEAPVVTHLFFADDSLLFGKVNQRECGALREVITKYGAVSGQRINFKKSSNCFSTNTPEADCVLFCNELGVNEVAELGRYLGLPSYIGRNKVAVFNTLKDKMWSTLNAWYTKFLS